jgi:hypothetical protein
MRYRVATNTRKIITVEIGPHSGNNVERRFKLVVWEKSVKITWRTWEAESL